MNTKISGIYCYINNINNKIYIGQSQNIYKRKSEHESMFKNDFGKFRENKYLRRAVIKYGRDNFEFRIIQECSIERLNELEEYYISFYKSNYRKYGYNLTFGGNTNRGYKHTEETKRKMSENHADFSGENHPLFGKRRPEETISKIRGKRGVTSSKYYGVFFHPIGKYQYWESRVTYDKKRIYLGRYISEIDAATAYNDYVMKNNLPHSLNFL